MSGLYLGNPDGHVAALPQQARTAPAVPAPGPALPDGLPRLTWLVLEVEDGDDEVGRVEEREDGQGGEGGRQLPELQGPRQLHGAAAAGQRRPPSFPPSAAQPRPAPGPASGGTSRGAASPRTGLWRRREAGAARTRSSRAAAAPGSAGAAPPALSASAAGAAAMIGDLLLCG